MDGWRYVHMMVLHVHKVFQRDTGFGFCCHANYISALVEWRTQGAICKGCVRCLWWAREGKAREGMGPMLYHRGTAIPPPSPASLSPPPAQLADSKLLLDDRLLGETNGLSPLELKSRFVGHFDGGGTESRSYVRGGGAHGFSLPPQPAPPLSPGDHGYNSLIS